MVVRQGTVIHIEDLNKSFDNRLVLRDVNIDIDNGSIVGIYGRSGIGKSTLAKILCGVMTPDTGSIHIDGQPLCSPGSYDRALGAKIQMVYQQPYASLDPVQKLRSGFRELIKYHGKASSRREADELTARLVERVGLGTEILDHLPHQISGGEAQRIAIARCLLLEPSVLILDEATSMLDVSTQANVIALVKRIMRQSGGSIILISHDWELVYFICDKIYIFDEDHKLKERKKE